MRIIPLSLKIANQFIKDNHRHHQPVRGCKFSIGLYDTKLRGVLIAGRPVSRMLDDGLTLEVTRLATDGVMNGCSMLYGAAARIAKEMGYTRIITYILDSEPGTSLKASGWIKTSDVRGQSWSRPSRQRQTNLIINKQRFEKQLAVWH